MDWEDRVRSLYLRYFEWCQAAQIPPERILTFEQYKSQVRDEITLSDQPIP